MAGLRLRSIGVLFAVLTACLFVFHLKNLYWKDKPQRFQLGYIPENYLGCHDVVPNISMSTLYEQMQPEFKMKKTNSVIGNDRNIESWGGKPVGELKNMHHLAGHRHVKTVCETGFNFGQGALTYLTANDQLIVHSFDIGHHKYVFPMSEYMKTKFPDRFFIHFGDSTKTVPEFIKENPNFECDLMMVDGGHTYPVALADIKNFAMIANLEDNLMIFDDFPTDWGKKIGKAWYEMIRAGVIKQIMGCTFTRIPGNHRGFSLGRVMKRPTV